MNWLRSKAKRLSLLAMFALALQFGLSFGHFHNDLGIATASASASQSPRASTPGTGHDQHAHRDLCAICATVAMTGNAVAAATPSLPLPPIFATYQAALDSESIAPDSRRGAFRSRAPPQS